MLTLDYLVNAGSCPSYHPLYIGKPFVWGISTRRFVRLTFHSFIRLFIRHLNFFWSTWLPSNEHTLKMILTHNLESDASSFSKTILGSSQTTYKYQRSHDSIGQSYLGPEYKGQSPSLVHLTCLIISRLY